MRQGFQPLADYRNMANLGLLDYSRNMANLGLLDSCRNMANLGLLDYCRNMANLGLCESRTVSARQFADGLT